MHPEIVPGKFCCLVCKDTSPCNELGDFSCMYCHECNWYRYSEQIRKGYCEFKRIFPAVIQRFWEDKPLPGFTKWIRGWDVDG